MQDLTQRKFDRIWLLFWQSKGELVAPKFEANKKEADWWQDWLDFCEDYRKKYPLGDPYDDFNNYGDGFYRDV